MELYWVNRGLVMARDGERLLSVGGEALRGRDPDFVIYAEYITHWEDGTPLGEEEKRDVLRRVVEEAARNGWMFEIE